MLASAQQAITFRAFGPGDGGTGHAEAWTPNPVRDRPDREGREAPPSVKSFGAAKRGGDMRRDGSYHWGSSRYGKYGRNGRDGANHGPAERRSYVVRGMRGG